MVQKQVQEEAVTVIVTTFRCRKDNSKNVRTGDRLTLFRGGTTEWKRPRQGLASRSSIENGGPN